jgi:hypothetical protein
MDMLREHGMGQHLRTSQSNNGEGDGGGGGAGIVEGAAGRGRRRGRAGQAGAADERDEDMFGLMEFLTSMDQNSSEEGNEGDDNERERGGGERGRERSVQRRPLDELIDPSSTSSSSASVSASASTSVPNAASSSTSSAVAPPVPKVDPSRSRIDLYLLDEKGRKTRLTPSQTFLQAVIEREKSRERGNPGRIRSTSSFWETVYPVVYQLTPLEGNQTVNEDKSERREDAKLSLDEKIQLYPFAELDKSLDILSFKEKLQFLLTSEEKGLLHERQEDPSVGSEASSEKEDQKKEKESSNQEATLFSILLIRICESIYSLFPITFSHLFNQAVAPPHSCPSSPLSPSDSCSPSSSPLPLALPDSSSFVNLKLSTKLRRQMQDLISVCTGDAAYPSWCSFFCSFSPFFFPFELRRNFLFSSKMGILRFLGI